MTLARLVLEERAKRGDSRESAAREIGVCSRTVLRWEQGVSPTVPAIAPLARYLGISAGEVLALVRPE